MAVDTSKKVLIIGGGIAGLVLAQILRANGIAFEIFERDATSTGRNQGYSVGLVESLPHLEELLPKDIGDIESISVNAGSGIPDSISLLNVETGKILAKFGGFPKGHAGYSIRANRPKARDFLLQKLDVRAGKRFTHYTEDGDSVTAHFEDGSTAVGSLLVGADGSRSRVRTQMLGEGGPKLEISNWQTIHGELELPRTQYEALCRIATTAIAAIYRNTFRFVWAVREARPDGGCKCFWGMVWHTDDPAADVAWLRASDKESKYRKVLDLARPLPRILHELIELTGAAGISDTDLVFTEFAPPESLPGARATLIGDAAHTMLPMRGAGANASCMDACDLARILARGWASGEAVEAMRREYEALALPRGRELVWTSRQAGESPEVMARLAARGRHNTLGREMDGPGGKSADGSVLFGSEVEVA